MCLVALRFRSGLASASVIFLAVIQLERLLVIYLLVACTSINSTLPAEIVQHYFRGHSVTKSLLARDGTTCHPTLWRRVGVRFCDGAGTPYTACALFRDQTLCSLLFVWSGLGAILEALP